MALKKIKFKSKAELWFPTVIWETELDDNSKEENLSKIRKILKNSNIESKIINIQENEFKDKISNIDTKGNKISNNMISNMRNILKSIEIAQNENSDLFYFVFE